ncbi:hypothetical protein TNIN_295471 [Trichonephila inaurata madagascariensis]|uniref:Uncharacterized protein n=1 Tax=Trichonephila inaurata madagascariensis TaxID=2747483 RepID=A0A8X6X8E5_9ARAC|nr:hypothetical protein TNIN_295471 [Trichonephila inaurata madagascariensis]
MSGKDQNGFNKTVKDFLALELSDKPQIDEYERTLHAALPYRQFCGPTSHRCMVDLLSKHTYSSSTCQWFFIPVDGRSRLVLVVITRIYMKDM